MAARLRPHHQDDVRRKIQVVQLINFLQAHALTGKDTGGQEVSPARIQSARILLDKTVSNLQSTEITGADGGPLTVEIVKFAGKTSE